VSVAVALETLVDPCIIGFGSSPSRSGPGHCCRGIEYHAVNLSAGIRVDGAWHIQNVNAYHSRLKAWVYQFRGVATCYLANYLSWFRAIDRNSAGEPKPALCLSMALGTA
jgi:hypothetical protein